MQLIIAVLLFLLAGIANATTYYVRTDGNNSCNGRYDAAGSSGNCAFLTIQQASNTMVAGDTTIVNAGTYGGWYAYASGTAGNPITYRASGTVTINTGANANGDLVRFDSQNYNTLDGFTVTSAPRFGIRLVNGTGLVAQNCIAHDNGESNIFTGYAPGVQILNNTAYNAGTQHGIYVSNSNVSPDNPIITGNTIYDNTQNGIQLNGDCGTAPTDGWIDGFTLSNNYIYHNGWKGLSIISARQGTISNNVLYNNGWNGGSAGGIHLVQETGASCPTYTSDDNVIVNNTIVEPVVAGIRINGANRTIMFNNIIISSNPYVNEYGGTQYHSTASSIEQSGTSGLFVSATSNWHLLVGASARNIGVTSYQSTNAPSTDKDGLTRTISYDAGAYEYDGTSGSSVSTLSGMSLSGGSVR